MLYCGSTSQARGRPDARSPGSINRLALADRCTPPRLNRVEKKQGKDSLRAEVSMEIEEHFYTDDPSIGHPDVRTRHPDTDYFFLGNGFIHAAVQVCRSGEATPIGLLLMNPDRLGPKRAALTCDPESGLENTMVSVRVGGSHFHPDPKNLHAEWEEPDGVPTVRVSWASGPVRVVERFFCPHHTRPHVARQVEVRLVEASHGDPGQKSIIIEVGFASPREVTFHPSDDRMVTATLIHEVRLPDDPKGEGRPTVATWWAEDPGPSQEATDYWAGLTTFRSGDPDLDHLFQAARNHLPTAVDHQGRMDGSIWQYNLEWVRDQAHVAEALVRLGELEKARTMLARLLDQFVSPDGDTVDSGRRRPASDVELDQNGELLTALGTYVDWTGDLGLVESRWEKLRSLASFPFSYEFAHSPSGLLHNRREYWERHGGHGIEDGFELMSQFYVALGLEAAARLADALGRSEDGGRWRSAADGLRRGILEDPLFSLIEESHFIKRRGTDGSWQKTIEMESDFGLPRAIPLLQDGPHFLDPDTSSVLPIANGFIDPRGDLARGTLAHVEELWNQWWEGGGYGRYHASSEPDSPGAWPFASLFVARAYAEAGQDEKVWRVLRWLVSTPGGASGAWFENDGPRIAPPYPQVGFTPWTWAELVTLSVHHLLGVRPDLEGITLRPKLLEGLSSMEASLLVRGHRLHISCRAAGKKEEKSGSMRIPLPSSDVHVEILC
jgi:hypothetical protein